MQIHVPEDVTEIDNISEGEEIDDEQMGHNNDDSDDAINDRYKITGVSEEEVDDDPTGVQNAQDDNTDVELGKGRRRKVKNP